MGLLIKSPLEKESDRLIDIMMSHPIDSREYITALARFKEVHQELLEQKKLSEFRLGHVLDIGGTLVLAGITLSYEYWSPITSRWASEITRSFKNGAKLSFRQPK